MIFKGSWPALKFQDCVWRYLPSRTRLVGVQNSPVGVIFEAWQNEIIKFAHFSKFSNYLGISSESSQ